MNTRVYITSDPSHGSYPAGWFTRANPGQSPPRFVGTSHNGLTTWYVVLFAPGAKWYVTTNWQNPETGDFWYATNHDQMIGFYEGAPVGTLQVDAEYLNVSGISSNPAANGLYAYDHLADVYDHVGSVSWYLYLDGGAGLHYLINAVEDGNPPVPNYWTSPLVLSPLGTYPAGTGAGNALVEFPQTVLLQQENPMSVTLTYGTKLTAVETIENNTVGASAANRRVTYDQLDTSLSLNGASTPPVSKVAVFEQALVAGAVDIDLTALPGTNGALVNGTGLKVQALKFKNPAANTQAITVTKGSTNGYAFNGISGVTVPPGAEILMFGNNALPAIDATHKVLSLSGYGVEKLQVELVLG